MAVAAIHSLSNLLRLTWLTGPIFDKELRVVSRRKRHFLLRFAYLAMLSIFVVVSWVSVVETQQTGAGAIFR